MLETTTRQQQNAEVAELADAHGSGPCGSNTLRVRLPSSAVAESQIITVWDFLYHGKFKNTPRDHTAAEGKMSLKRPAEGGESCEQDSLFLFIIDPLVISLPSPEHIQVIPGREHFSHLVKHIQIPTCIYKHRTEQQASYDKKGDDAAEYLGPAAGQL